MSSPSAATYVLNYSDLMMKPDRQSNEDCTNSLMEQSPKPCTYCLFLGDISLFCSEDDLIRAFEKFGQLADVRIKRNRVTKRNLSYGFVEYYDFQSAEAAVRAMNGQVVCGRALKVRWSESKDTTDDDKKCSSESDSKLDSSKVVSIYIAFNSTVPNMMINDETLRQVFAPFGQLEDVSIKQSVIDRQTECQRGYAFVCFPPNEQGMQAAMYASAQLSDCHIGGVHYRCELSNNLRSKISPVPSVTGLLPTNLGSNISSNRGGTSSFDNFVPRPMTNMPMLPPPQQPHLSSSQHFRQGYFQPNMPSMMISPSSPPVPATGGASSMMVMQHLAPSNVSVMFSHHLNQTQMLHVQQPMFSQPALHNSHHHAPRGTSMSPPMPPVPQPLNIGSYPSHYLPMAPPTIAQNDLRHTLDGNINMMAQYSTPHVAPSMPSGHSNHILSTPQFVPSSTTYYQVQNQQQSHQQPHFYQRPAF